jgi:hypothetical protein
MMLSGKSLVGCKHHQRWALWELLQGPKLLKGRIMLKRELSVTVVNNRLRRWEIQKLLGNAVAAKLLGANKAEH